MSLECTDVFNHSNYGIHLVSVILSMVSSMIGTDYGAMMAAIFFTMLPLLVLYVVLQEQVVKGLTAGSVKG